jgi:hypothetical protein
MHEIVDRECAGETHAVTVGVSLVELGVEIIDLRIGVAEVVGVCAEREQARERQCAQ